MTETLLGLSYDKVEIRLLRFNTNIFIPDGDYEGLLIIDRMNWAG